MSRTARASALLLVVVTLAPSCRRASEQEQAAALCHDLLALRATATFLAAPGPGATVGQVRGALEKLDPTFGAVKSSDAVPSATGADLVDAQEAYRDVLAGVGDDDAFQEVSADAAAPARHLQDLYSGLLTDLGCLHPPASGV